MFTVDGARPPDAVHEEIVARLPEARGIRHSGFGETPSQDEGIGAYLADPCPAESPCRRHLVSRDRLAADRLSLTLPPGWA